MLSGPNLEQTCDRAEQNAKEENSCKLQKQQHSSLCISDGGDISKANGGYSCEGPVGSCKINTGPRNCHCLDSIQVLEAKQYTQLRGIGGEAAVYIVQRYGFTHTGTFDKKCASCLLPT